MHYGYAKPIKIIDIISKELEIKIEGSDSIKIKYKKYLLKRDQQLIMYNPIELNKYILINDETPDNRRIYSVRLNYENESFQRMRYELSKFFNQNPLWQSEQDSQDRRTL